MGTTPTKLVDLNLQDNTRQSVLAGECYKDAVAIKYSHEDAQPMCKTKAHLIHMSIHHCLDLASGKRG